MQANAYEPSEALNASIGLATWCAWPQEGDGSTARTMVVWDADQLNRKVLEPLLKLVLQKTESIRKSAQHINYCQNKIQVQGKLSPICMYFPLSWCANSRIKCPHGM